jgi:hypothetical protein
MLRDLGIHIEAEAAVNVFLCRRHLTQAALVLLYGLCLIGQHDFRVKDDGKIHHHDLAQHAWEGGVGQVFQANERVQQATDLEVIIELVFDVDISHLTARTLVNEGRLRPTIWQDIVRQRIECSLNLKEEVVMGHAFDLRAGRLECCFHTGH